MKKILCITLALFLSVGMVLAMEPVSLSGTNPAVFNNSAFQNDLDLSNVTNSSANEDATTNDNGVPLYLLGFLNQKV